MFLVVRPPDTLFLPPSIVPKWRGLRGLAELRAVAPVRPLRPDRVDRARDDLAVLRLEQVRLVVNARHAAILRAVQDGARAVRAAGAYPRNPFHASLKAGKIVSDTLPMTKRMGH